MWGAEIVRALRERGELWDAAPGVVGLRGAALGAYRTIEGAIAALAAGETRDEWQVPSGIGFETLARAGYFASFPQWLTAAAHLAEDVASLERVATSAEPAEAVRRALAPAEIALAPAVCYHTYARLADSVIAGPMVMTAQGTCWRHEGEGRTALERGWAFTMREVVYLGDDAGAEAFRARGLEKARGLASQLGLETSVVEATDPFFAPTARGRAALQRVKGLKHELTVTLPGGRPLAIASFNNHERYFGDAFAIRLADGTPAASACVAFGLERWLLACLAMEVA